MSHQDTVPRGRSIRPSPGLRSACIPAREILRTFQERARPDTEVPPKLKAILKEQLEVEERRITWDARLVDDLGVDSLGCAGLIMALEEGFGLDIPDEVAEKFERVGDIVEYLRKRGVTTLRG